MNLTGGRTTLIRTRAEEFRAKPPWFSDLGEALPFAPDAGRYLPALRRALTDPDWRLRAGAVLALGKWIGDPEAMPAIVRALDDSHETVRELAATAMGALESRADAAAALRTALARSDTTARFRVLAGSELMWLGRAAPTDPAMAAEGRRTLIASMADGDAANWAIQVLRADSQWADVGEAVLRYERGWAVGYLRAEALGLMLAKLGADAVEPALDAIVASLTEIAASANEDDAAHAIQVLGKCRARAARIEPLLVGALADPRRWVRQEAVGSVRALRLQSPAVVEGLITVLEHDRYMDHRTIAAQALAEIPSAAASSLPALTRAAAEWSEPYREHAVQAVASIRRSH